MAARLHLAEALADGPRAVAELTGTHAPSLHRLMRVLQVIFRVVAEAAEISGQAPTDHTSEKE